MIVHPKKIVSQEGVLHISSSIESNSTSVKLPESLWFSVPSSAAAYIPENMNSFLTTLLPVAMFFGESVHIKGSVSAKLLYNLREFQRVLHFWRPEWFSIVTVSYDALATDLPAVNAEKNKGVLGSFSGGTDSMYTLWSHLPENEPIPEFQMTHTMFVKNFDAPRTDIPTQNTKLETYQKLMDKIGMTFLPIGTNAKDFYYFNNDKALMMTYMAMLVGIAQLLENRIGTFYFSSDNTHDFPTLSVISHQLVPLLSTDALKADVFGATVTKMEKLEKLISWPESYSHLTVCWENPNKLQNCGQCGKCCLTTASLDMLNALHLYSTFPAKVFHNKIRTLTLETQFLCFIKTWIFFAKKHKRYDLVFDFTFALWRNRFIHYILKPVMKIKFKPLKPVFDLSNRLKRYSPSYAKFVYWLKQT